MVPLKRGDVVDVDLEGAKGTEKQNDDLTGSRPCLVIQNDVGNQRSPMTIIVPLTEMDQFKNLPVQVVLDLEELHFRDSKQCLAECGHIRTIDRNVRIINHRGYINNAAMRRVDIALAISVGLQEV